MTQIYVKQNIHTQTQNKIFEDSVLPVLPPLRLDIGNNKKMYTQKKNKNKTNGRNHDRTDLGKGYLFFKQEEQLL